MRRFALVLAVSLLGVWSADSTCLFAAPAEAPKKEIPPAEDISLKTRDGLELKATFYASAEGKEAVPVVLLHGFKGNRQDFAALADKLQQLGHAVIVPDLRGHGESTKLVRLGSEEKTLEATALRKDDFGLMVTQDMETIKSFIKERNNAQELNLQKLCVLGADMGAMVAMNWSVLDWSWPPLATGKQGQDVKAVVLVSPPLNFKGIALSKTMETEAVRRELSVLLIFGNTGTPKVDAERLNKQFTAFRAANLQGDKKDYFFYPRKTSLQGTKILNEPSLGAEQLIAKFIELRLVKQSFPWETRKSPLE